MFFDALINCAKDIADRVNLFHVSFLCVRLIDDNVMMTVKRDKDDGDDDDDDDEDPDLKGWFMTDPNN